MAHLNVSVSVDSVKMALPVKVCMHSSITRISVQRMHATMAS